MRAGECPAVKSGSAMLEKSKTPARGFLRANCFDDQGMSQGGQVCQQKILHRFNAFPAGGFRWLASGLGGFPGFRRVDFTVFVKNPP
jgi:hypothetical protein